MENCIELYGDVLSAMETYAVLCQGYGVLYRAMEPGDQWRAMGTYEGLWRLWRSM